MSSRTIRNSVAAPPPTNSVVGADYERSQDTPGRSRPKLPSNRHSKPEERGKEERMTLLDELQCLFAELVGSFALTFVAAGCVVVAAVSHNKMGDASQVVAPGMMVMALIYAMGDASGAHFNPVVTLAFFLRGIFPLKRLPGYWIAQFAGGILAALALKGIFGTVHHLGASTPEHGVVPALIIEVITTFFLLLVILGTATRYSLVGPNAALAVGATIALDGLLGGPISGASMNPQRSLAPMILAGDMRYAWIYVVGPLIGAVLAVLAMMIIHCHADPKQAEAAQGGGEQKPSS